MVYSCVTMRSSSLMHSYRSFEFERLEKGLDAKQIMPLTGYGLPVLMAWLTTDQFCVHVASWLRK